MPCRNTAEALVEVRKTLGSAVSGPLLTSGGRSEAGIEGGQSTGFTLGSGPRAPGSSRYPVPSNRSWVLPVGLHPTRFRLDPLESPGSPGRRMYDSRRRSHCNAGCGGSRNWFWRTPQAHQAAGSWRRGSSDNHLSVLAVESPRGRPCIRDMPNRCTSRGASSPRPCHS